MLFLAVLLVGVAFAACTQHAWEDYWITFRASRNLATGHGLVFVPGERVHSYTSPLGALLPAFFSRVTGNRSDGLTLWLFRLASLGALGSGVVLFFQILRSVGLRSISCLLAVGLIGLDAKTVDFSINGMETGIMILFLALSAHGLLVEGPRRIIRLGLGWAGLMWTRPDSFIHIGILALAILIFLPDRQTSRTAWFKKMLPAGLICAVLYLPWIVWAWNYYGSPIPHTIVAKASISPLLPPGELVSRFFLLPFRFAKQYGAYRGVFMPPYAFFGGWSLVLEYATAVIALLLSLTWLLPGVPRRTRMFSLTFFLGLFYLDAIVRGFYAWYVPPVEAMGFLTLGSLFDDVLSFAAKPPQSGRTRGWSTHVPLILRFGGGLLITVQLILLVCTGREVAVQQSLIEEGLRKPLGLWLHDHARSPQDTVMLEPLGYIGYFSQLKMYDYPGLSSSEMVEARRRLGPDKQNLVYRELKPDWLVLRPSELAKPGSMIDPTHLDEMYDPVIVFDVSDKLAAVQWLPGRRYLEYDQKFFVFHRKDSIPPATELVSPAK